MAKLIGALIYEPDSPVDAVVRRAVSQFARDGMKVCGCFQIMACEDGVTCNDMSVEFVPQGGTRSISQPLGAASEGCRLDPGALVEVGVQLEGFFTSDFDLLVMNRFGKMEAEGGGLRSVIALSIERNIPVLLPVQSRHVPALKAYAEEFVEGLSLDPASIREWFARLRAPVVAQLA